MVIVGDSLTAGNVKFIGPSLRAAGLDVRIEALSARRIAVSFDFMGPRDSGVARVRALKAAGVEPELWVIELGSNDLGVVENCQCADPVAFAGEIIDQLLDEIGPGVPIAWVTVFSRNQLDGSASFNTALGVRAIANPYLTVIRWDSLVAHQPGLFLDHVHPNADGVNVLTQLYIDRISELLDNPLGPTIPGPGLARADRLGSR